MLIYLVYKSVYIKSKRANHCNQRSKTLYIVCLKLYFCSDSASLPFCGMLSKVWSYFFFLCFNNLWFHKEQVVATHCQNVNQCDEQSS